MTIPAGQSGVTYHTGNGTASTFDYEFKITAEADLKVTQTDTAGVDTVLVLNTDYTVTGVGNNAGGSITLVAGALASNYTLAIEDNVEVSQLTPFGNQSAFYANLHEDAYDKNTRIARKSIYELDRVLKIPASVQGVNTELPKPEGLNLFRWNEDGTALENVETADLITTAQFSNFKTDTFVDGIDFTAGTTTTVTLDSAPGTKANTQVYFDGVYQEKSEYSLAATVITFDNPIPIGVGAVEVVYGKAADVLAPSTREVQIADGVATAYTLSNSYEPGNGTLHVYINGVRQEVGYGYAETNDSTVTFDSAPANGDRLLFLVNPYAPQTTADANNVTYTHPASGAVATNVGARLSQTVSVKDFGAVGDGVTDDTAAIQAAIDAAGSGGSVFIPAGRYRIEDTAGLKINQSNFALYGEGKDVSILESVYTGTTMLTIADDDSFNNILRYITVSSIGINASSTGDSVYASGHGIVVTNAAKVALNSIWVNDQFIGVQINGSGEIICSDWRIYSDAKFSAFASGSRLLKIAPYTSVLGEKSTASFTLTGFNLRTNSNNGYLDKCVEVQASDGIWFTNGHFGFASSSCFTVTGVAGSSAFIGGLNFSNVHFDGNSVSDYCLNYNIDATYSGVCQGHSYNGCFFSLCNKDAVYINGSNKVEQLAFVGGRVNTWDGDDAVGAAFRLNDCEQVSIQGVEMYASNGTEYAGIILDDADYCSIDSMIDGRSVPSFYGIRVTNTSTRNTIKCTFQNCATDVDYSGSNNDNNITGTSNNAAKNVTASSSITLSQPYKLFSVSGNTTIDSINSTSGQSAREVILRFSGTPTVTDSAVGTANGISLHGGAFTAANGATLSLVYDGVMWLETGRNIP